jgi:lysozyme family protein
MVEGEEMTEYPKDFLKAVNHTLEWEGGYVWDAHDSGGETNFGISKKSYPNLDISMLSRDDAIEIYYKDYWLANNIPAIAGTDDFRAKVFDMCVLMGSRSALQLMRGCTGLSSYEQVCSNHFHTLVHMHSGLARYLKGWLNRVYS